MLLTKLNELLALAKIKLSIEQKNLLISYIKLIDKWNKSYNLTSVRNPEEMIARHIIDSIVINPWLKGKYFIDVGSGAGLPGLPLAIIRPDSTFVLLDSLGKRVRFLKQAKFELGLKNIIPVQQRVEEYHTQSPFDGVISRAFATLNNMVTWCRSLPIQKEGCYYALKGDTLDEELASLPDWITLHSIISLQIPQTEAQRCLVVMKRKINLIQ